MSGLDQGEIVAGAPIVQRSEDQGAYRFGYMIEGVPVWFAARKLGGIDDDLRRAREEVAANLAAAAAETVEPAAPAPGPDESAPLPGDPGPSAPVA